MCPSFTEETIQYLDFKLSEHRDILQHAFPDYRLRPKHHYMEHYPDHIRVFGSLVHVWTMRFEAKHQLLKRTAREAHNFKNVAWTVAERHQKTMAYYLDSASFFRPALELGKVTSTLISSFPDSVQQQLFAKYPHGDTILTAKAVTIDGIDYTTNMVVSVGSCAGLPEFQQIHKILILNASVVFVCMQMTAWYHAHLRSFEVCKSSCMVLTSLSDCNDVYPLSVYKVKGKLYVTLKHYIFC